MAMLGWVMMGLAIWHYTIFMPDRFWGGIVGAFLGSLFGAAIVGLDHQHGQVLRIARAGRKGDDHRRRPVRRPGRRARDRPGVPRGHAPRTRRPAGRSRAHLADVPRHRLCRGGPPWCAVSVPARPYARSLDEWRLEIPACPPQAVAALRRELGGQRRARAGARPPRARRAARGRGPSWTPASSTTRACSRASGRPWRASRVTSTSAGASPCTATTTSTGSARRR